MRQNPCRYCSSSVDIKGKHSASFSEKCCECDYRKQHMEYLKKHRKFDEGEPITSLDELLKQEWVMWYHITKHIEVIKHNQLSTVLKWLENGAIHKAIRKESEVM
jgi:hypothetical protein